MLKINSLITCNNLQMFMTLDHRMDQSQSSLRTLSAQCSRGRVAGTGHTLAREMKAGSGGPPSDSGFDSLELAADRGTSGGQLSIYTLGRGS